MGIILCTLICTALVSIPASPALAGLDRATALRELNWPMRWASVIGRQSDKYLDRVAKNDFAALPESRRNSALDKLRHQIEQELSWTHLGKRFATVMTASCSDDVLQGLIQIKRRQIAHERAQHISKAYKKCATDGYSRALPLLKSGFKRMLPALRRSIEAQKKQ